MRFISLAAALAAAALLAACGTPATAPSDAAPSAVVVGTPAGAARDWNEYKLRAARRIQVTSAGETFSGPLPDPLQSIPVLLVQLHRDGSIRDIVVQRVPGQSPQTVDMAIRAIRRAAPFGPVAHLPRPWQFSETFLYDDSLRFQLRTLVEAAP